MGNGGRGQPDEQGADSYEHDSCGYSDYLRLCFSIAEMTQSYEEDHKFDCIQSGWKHARPEKGKRRGNSYFARPTNRTQS